MTATDEDLIMLEREGASRGQKYVEDMNAWLARLQPYLRGGSIREQLPALLALLAGFLRVLVHDLGLRREEGLEVFVAGMVDQFARGGGVDDALRLEILERLMAKIPDAPIAIAVTTEAKRSLS